MVSKEQFLRNMMDDSKQESDSEFDSAFSIFRKIDELEKRIEKLKQLSAPTPSEAATQEKMIGKTLREIKTLKDKLSSANLLDKGSPERRTEIARQAANAKYDKPGSSRENKERLIKIWQKGKYKTFAHCATEHYESLGVTYETATRYLKGQPKAI